MATLAAISFNLVGSVGVFAVTMVAFGCAVRSQNTFVAARCTARPPTVIYNPNPYRHPSQDRGSPMLGWIMWVMKLTYGTMLRGIPGTGTRQGGLAGSLLSVNLDGIVLLRFHHLCLRVSMLATVLYLTIVLPIYATAQCSRIKGDDTTLRCQESTLTDYQRLTLANIPVLDFPKPDSVGDLIASWFVPAHDGAMARLYAVVLVAWIVTSYFLRELQVEWGDVLAMRRVYYLEADHWKDRQEELDSTLFRGNSQKMDKGDNDDDNDDPTASSSTDKSEESHMTDRMPWIPHPEQRDTVPNIELYSVLVGGLPSLPTEVLDKDVEAVFSRKQSIDWQLAVTTAFFDHCVPNQPGFSSSIAAVTILPSAQHLTQAWNEWYRVAAKLRRLQFIRQQIGIRWDQERAKKAALVMPTIPAPPPSLPQYSKGHLSADDDLEAGRGGQSTHSTNTRGGLQRSQHSVRNFLAKTFSSRLAAKTPAVFEQSGEKNEYYNEILGSKNVLNLENQLLFALHFGPEQTASYAREFALGAANLAPFGWHERRIRTASLAELVRMEKTAVEELHEANADLRIAQDRIAEDDSSEEDGDKSDEEIGIIMQASMSSNLSLRSLSGDELDEVDIEDGTRRPRMKRRNSFRDLTLQAHEETQNDRSTKGDLVPAQSMRSRGIASLDSFDSDDDDSFFGDSTASGESYDEALTGNQNEVQHSSRRKQRSKSIDTLASNLSFESEGGGRRKRPSMLGGMTAAVLKPMLSRSASSDLKNAPNTSLRQKKKPQKARLGSAQLPSDLGLEAGLWMESMHGTSQHVRNRKAPPRRAKSSMHGSMHTPNKGGGRSAQRSAPKRTRSSDDVDLFEVIKEIEQEEAAIPKKTAPTRTLSSDAVELLAASWNFNNPPKVLPLEFTEEIDLQLSTHSIQAEGVSPKADTGKTSRQSGKDRIGEHAKSPNTEQTRTDGHAQPIGPPKLSRQNSKLASLSKQNSSQGQPASSASIWTKLAEDKERKQKLRQRLNNIKKGDEQAKTSSSSDSESTSSDSDSVSSIEISKPKSESRFSATGEMEVARSLLADESPVRPKRVREYRSEVGPRQPRTNRAAGANRTQLPQTLAGGAPKQSTDNTMIPRMPLLMKALNEDATDDDSVDVKEIMDAAAAYRQNAPQTSYAHGSYSNNHDISQSSFSSRRAEENIQMSLEFEEKAGLRHRESAASRMPQRMEKEDKWAKVTEIVQESNGDKHAHRATHDRMISSGKWGVPTLSSTKQAIQKQIGGTMKYFLSTLKPPDLVDDLVRDSSYAVVTFTSRQAAVAARHCLADSRGNDRWKTVQDVPSPPLADAPVFQMSSFRGCVRPVTLSISDKQKLLRHSLAIAALITIYFFYTIPLTAAQALVSVDNLSRIFPDIESLQESSVFLSNILSGVIPALVWTAFFAACPPMFKVIANFGSNATSSVTAENSALHYFWWFMLLSAFTGTSFARAFTNGFTEGLSIGSEIQNVIESTATDIPIIVSAHWLNWMIVRTFAVLPTQYLLQLNTFIFTCLGLKCCARSVRGGGAGGPIPYRIYVDSGVVMLCLSALAPASPLVAPAAFAYFLVCTPMLRWTIIFLYRPKFDVGGGRFPFIFDICISGLLLGQILLVTMMVLKAAIGPAILAFLPMVPTIWFRHFVRSRYLRAFNDAALLQTSLLDGWDTNEASSQEKREEFRRFLVDCHKAAYVPVCIAGDETTTITAEPALVVSNEMDEDLETVYEGFPTHEGPEEPFEPTEASSRQGVNSLSTRKQSLGPRKRGNSINPGNDQSVQMGVMMRRASTLVRQQKAGVLSRDDSAVPQPSPSSPQKQAMRRISSVQPRASVPFGSPTVPFGSPNRTYNRKSINRLSIPASPLL